MDSVGGCAVGSCPSATSTFRKALVGYTVGVWWYVAICCQGNGSYYNIYVEQVPPENGSATADNDFEVTKPLKVWKHLGEIEIYVYFAESHQHEHNEHMTWKHKKFTCLLERLKNDSEILRTSTLASIGPRTVWLVRKSTFQLQLCDSSPSIPTWHCLRSCSCKVPSGISTAEAWVFFFQGQLEIFVKTLLIKIKVGFTKSDQYSFQNTPKYINCVHPNSSQKTEEKRTFQKWINFPQK